jgi:predicted nucleic acid-binding protein
VTVDIIHDDPADNRILECGIAGHADVIVSGDRHLLKLKSCKGIPVVRPIDFRRTLGLRE